jgi:hypothetical protein
VANDTEALVRAAVGCQSSSGTVWLPPGKAFRSWPLSFVGAAWRDSVWQLDGNLTNGCSPSTWPGRAAPALLHFADFQQLTLRGNGTVHAAAAQARDPGERHARWCVCVVCRSMGKVRHGG